MNSVTGLHVDEEVRLRPGPAWTLDSAPRVTPAILPGGPSRTHSLKPSVPGPCSALLTWQL